MTIRFNIPKQEHRLAASALAVCLAWSIIGSTTIAYASEVEESPPQENIETVELDTQAKPQEAESEPAPEPTESLPSQSQPSETPNKEPESGQTTTTPSSSPDTSIVIPSVQESPDTALLDEYARILAERQRAAYESYVTGFTGPFNPDYGVERTEAEWTAAFSDLKLTGIWLEDMITIAESQLGYTESQMNFIFNDNRDTKGYTRFGEWWAAQQGLDRRTYVYGDWCAMYLSFCIHYAGIEGMPLGCHCSTWISDLEEVGLYQSRLDGAKPKRGNLVFFSGGPGTGTSSSHVGLVIGVDDNYIYTIEGNLEDKVMLTTHEINFSAIKGYGSIPEQEGMSEEVICFIRSGRQVVDMPVAAAAEEQPSTEQTGKTQELAKPISATEELYAEKRATRTGGNRK